MADPAVVMHPTLGALNQMLELGLWPVGECAPCRQVTVVDVVALDDGAVVVRCPDCRRRVAGVALFADKAGLRALGYELTRLG
jgi:hypothetical protein